MAPGSKKCRAFVKKTWHFSLDLRMNLCLFHRNSRVTVRGGVYAFFAIRMPVAFRLRKCSAWATSTHLPKNRLPPPGAKHDSKAKYSTGRDSKSRYPTAKGSKVKNPLAEDSKARDSKIKDPIAQDSKVWDPTVKNSTGRDPTVKTYSGMCVCLRARLSWPRQI